MNKALDMNSFIYVLFLSIWTINCLNTNQSDVSCTTAEAKQSGPTLPKMDNFRKRLLIFIVGIMITAFAFTCFFFLHFNCVDDDAPKEEMVQTEGFAAIPSCPCKIPVSDSKITNVCSLENYPMLYSIDKFSASSSPENFSSLPSSAEKLIRTPSPQKSSTLNSKEMFIRTPSPEKSTVSFSAEKLIRQSTTKTSSKLKNPKRLRKSSHLEKSHRMQSLEKLTHSYKLVRHNRSSYSLKSVGPRWVANSPSATRQAKSPCLPRSENQILSSKTSSIKKLTKSYRHPNLNRSVSIQKAVMSSMPLLAKKCQCYKERCLVCNSSSEFLVNNISEAKKKSAGNHHVSNKMKHFPKSKDKAYNDNVNGSDRMTHDSDNDSDTEIIIICNIRHNDVIPKDIMNS